MRDHRSSPLNSAMVIPSPIALVDPRRQRVCIGDPQKEVLVVVELRGQSPDREEVGSSKDGIRCWEGAGTVGGKEGAGKPVASIECESCR